MIVSVCYQVDIMNTYFLMFQVVPAQDNALNHHVQGALAHFWVLDKSGRNAQSRAEHYLAEHGWEIEKLEQSPVVTTPEQFAQRDIGLENYKKAQRFGIAAVFSAWEES